jgi:hypothetical protein
VKRFLLALVAVMVTLGATACVPPATGRPASAINRRASGTFLGTTTSQPGGCPAPAVSSRSFDLRVTPERGRETQLVLDGCVTERDADFAYDGTFTYTFARGTLQGITSGSISVDSVIAFSLTVTSGTGRWCNVRGTLALTGGIRFLLDPPVSGVVTAALTRDHDVDCAPSK